MRYSRALIRTSKETPSDATNLSHILLLRGGYAKRMGAGIYSLLPLGFKVLKKIEAIITEELDRTGAQQLLMPALLPAEFFKETGRWDVFSDNLFRLKDRKDGDYHLGPTHEEIITEIARREIKSWRDLPLHLYQIQSKFRDEPRPRAGLLRCREFIMKDAYSFDANLEDAHASYEQMREAYRRIFDRIGLTYRMVKADSGSMGGSKSAEFQVLAQSGEDLIVACESCSYASNIEVATTLPCPPVAETTELAAPEQVETVCKGSISDICKLLDVSAERCIKSVLYLVGEQWVMALVRGNHEVNEVKLARHLGVDEVTIADADQAAKFMKAPIGFFGPIGLEQVRLVVDRDVATIEDGICGSNKKHFHTMHVRYGRDFSGELAEIRSVQSGDTCPECRSTLKEYRGIEAGHIFVLGTHYTSQMGATYLDQEQQVRDLVMGCYGIGVSRLIAAAVEQNSDDNGIKWPMSIAPYQVVIAQLGKEDEIAAECERLEKVLQARGVDVLWDDRDERPGVKFKDADLLGIPLRLVVGGKSFAQGEAELKIRKDADPKRVQMINLNDVVETILDHISQALATPVSK